MASIPLPELQVQPPQQQDLLGAYGKLVALRSALQQQAYEQQMRPLQLQQEQQAVQMQQQQLKDAQAGQAAYGEWDGKDYTGLASLIIKHGGSLNAAQQVAMYGLNQQKTLSEILKNQGEGGRAQVEALQKNNDIAAGKVQALMDVADAQLPQAVLQTAQEGLRDGWFDKQHFGIAQQLSQASPAQIRAALPYFVKSYQSQSQQAEAALKAAQIQTAQQTAALGSLQADARNQWLAAHPTKSITDYTAMVAGQEQAAKEAGAFPYQARLAAIREQVNNTFWNNKDAMSEVENKYLAPYQQKMASVNELKSAVQLAQQGNVAAARGVVLKLMGVSNPDGTKRYNEAEARNMLTMGGVPDRFKGTVQNLLTGDQWTPKMAGDITSFADAQGQVAQQSLNSGIDSINTLHGTRIGQGLKAGGPASGVGGAGGGGHVIQIGNRFFQYNGMGATDDMKNYTEVSGAQR